MCENSRFFPIVTEFYKKGKEKFKKKMEDTRKDNFTITMVILPDGQIKHAWCHVGRVSDRRLIIIRTYSNFERSIYRSMVTKYYLFIKGFNSFPKINLNWSSSFRNKFEIRESKLWSCITLNYKIRAFVFVVQPTEHVCHSANCLYTGAFVWKKKLLVSWKVIDILAY